MALFCVEGVTRGKQFEVEVRVGVFEEVESDKRVGRRIDMRDVQEINRGVGNGRGKDERRLKFGDKGDQIGELFVVERGGVSTIDYI